MGERRVLILHTGGTIGMRDGPRGYVPAEGELELRLASIPIFHDPSADSLTVPPSRFGVRVRYEVLELTPLLDSAEVGPVEWVRVARAVEANYDAFDGFVVLHGTDTMAYTASALSFMLQGLEKSVVLTGSQIPIGRVRNDAVDNLLGALMVAGHYELPEVGIYFADQLLRGNRARKVDAQSLAAFRSANFPPLATVGVDVDVRWDLVLPPSREGLLVQPITNPHVAALRIFPSISAETVERFLRPPLQGLVLETYGAGNVPTRGGRLLRLLGEAVDRGVVIVNCTQCPSGTVRADYEGGRALSELGVVGGADMTPEAALTKLGWLLSLGLPLDDVRARMGRAERGELTEPVLRPRFSWRGPR